MSPVFILGIVLGYFVLLLIIARFTSRDSDNKAFFTANKSSPWYVVAFGMIGATLSGVTFISVPGAVGAGGLNQAFSYMQLVFGYVLGYAVIAQVLLPVYYRLKLTSIYEYLDQRFGAASYKTGAGFFLLSRVIGASFRLYLVAIVLDLFVLGPMGVPFVMTVAGTIVLIWIYTFQGGIKTVVWTDTFQTAAMLLAVVLAVWAIGKEMGLDGAGMMSAVQESQLSRVFFFENGWADPNNFFKQFLAGAFITVVMTGLDQDMMQKNLTIRTLGDAQKNMYVFTIVLVFVNLLFLSLGALLYIYSGTIADFAVERPDQLFPTIALEHLPPAIGIVFILGLIAAAYSSADSALTSLTTSFCVDILDFGKKGPERNQEGIRRSVHVGFSILLLLVIMVFRGINDQSVINQLFTVAGYTYGPLLGMYAFGLFTKLKVKDRWVPIVCINAPVLAYGINVAAHDFLGYKFGFELLILNGLLTFFGLLLIRRS